MLQVFCLDVAYICMLQAYVSSVFQVFHMYVCKCFIWMLQWVPNVFQVFSQVFHTLVSSVSFVFFCMLQLLHMDVSKVDRVLHMGCAWEAAGALAHKPDALGARSLAERVPPDASAPDWTSERVAI